MAVVACGGVLQHIYITVHSPQETSTQQKKIVFHKSLVHARLEDMQLNNLKTAYYRYGTVSNFLLHGAAISTTF